mgnify:CR=1 FL=1
MRESDHNRPLPRAMLYAATAMVVLSIVLAATARLTGIGRTEFAAVPAVESRELLFEDRADGAVTIYAADRSLIGVLPPGSDGFIRGVLRGLARDRKLHQKGADQPFRLTRWADGRLSIDDPATGRRIDLGAFGPTNAQAFARLFAADGPSI